MTKGEIFLQSLHNIEHNDYLRIKDALVYASDKHKDQLRKSGEPYIYHPIEVATILSRDFNADTDTIITALLHDVIEDTDSTYEEVSQLFGTNIADMVMSVTKIKGQKLDKNDYLNKIVTSLITDPRVIIIKLVDRLHNMRTLEYKKVESQKRIASETMNFYVPIADDLGLYKIKTELEDLSLKYLLPEKYKNIEDLRDMYRERVRSTLEETAESIHDLLNEFNINNKIILGTKNIYGIYKRLELGRTLIEISDINRIVVVVDNYMECYYVLGLIHKYYDPVLTKVKDYIGTPKYNKYMSLHTTIMEKNAPIQVQIRSREMNIRDIYGITIYWKLRKTDAKKAMVSEIRQNVLIKTKLENISNYFNSLEDNTKLFEKLDCNHIFIIGPDGSIIEVPINTTLGDLRDMYNDERIIINSFIDREEYTLKNGDTVTIRQKQKTK